MACFAVVSLAIFTFGVDVARERGNGWHRRLRITPLPMWVYFTGKAIMAIIFTTTILLLMAAVGVIGRVQLHPTSTLRTMLVIVAGALLFAPAGFALAFWTYPRAATAIGNLVFLPLASVSGYFYTLNGLPGFLQSTAPCLPTYHFGQLVWTRMAPVGDVVDFGSPTPDSFWVHLAWVMGLFVVCSVIAAVGYRRDATADPQ